MIPIMTLSLLAYFTHVSIYIAIYVLGTRSDHLESSRRWAESLRAPPWATRVNVVRYPWYQSSLAAPKCLTNEYMLVIMIFPVHGKVIEYSILESSTTTQNRQGHSYGDCVLFHRVDRIGVAPDSQIKSFG
jgi:hypothetical protein